MLRKKFPTPSFVGCNRDWHGLLSERDTRKYRLTLFSHSCTLRSQNHMTRKHHVNNLAIEMCGIINQKNSRGAPKILKVDIVHTLLNVDHAF